MRRDLSEYVDHFRARVLQDALNEATSRYWLHRAEQFENARPRLGEFHGQQTPEQLRAKWIELTEIAAACRARAKVSPLDLIDAVVPDVLGEVA